MTVSPIKYVEVYKKTHNYRNIYEIKDRLTDY